MLRQGIGRLVRTREFGVVVVLALLVLFISSTERGEAFLGPISLQNLSRQVALLGVFAIGQAVVIIAGGIDLSVGTLIGFTGVLCAWLLSRAGWSLGASVAAVLAFSACVGIVHALLIHRFRLLPFIVTLGSLFIFLSAGQLMTNNVPIPVSPQDSPYSEEFQFLGNGKIWGVPVPVYILLAVLIAVSVLMHFTVVGRHIYALGNNEEATRLSGISVLRTQMIAYGLCSLLAGLAGILYASYQRQGIPGSGLSYELKAIAAAVVSGCSLSGGQGTVIGAVIGAALLNVILSGISFVIQQGASNWEGTVVGTILLVTAILNRLQQQWLARKR
ncbi:MAG: ABC transporter permease [Armatimonadota bacterium]|nr:ABC transporter permease [bacterium]MCS7310701.1 ABC transporter permease [Armatimonadota bacterium]MDW8103606.1 ABC transporter permease [Armatimonadota bacterium]MDW8289216.1 ABC transporter permease [Armatimonadota bacterium]